MIEKSIEIDTELSPESGSWFSLWLRKIFDPAWLVAVAFHLVALLVLANWIMQNSNLQLGLEVAMDSDSFTILEEPDSLEFDFKLTEAEIQSDQEALVSEFEFDVDPVVDSISRQSMDFNYGRSLNEAMNASFDVTDLGPALLPSPGSVGGTEEDKKVAAIQSRVHRRVNGFFIVINGPLAKVFWTLIRIGMGQRRLRPQSRTYAGRRGLW